MKNRKKAKRGERRGRKKPNPVQPQVRPHTKRPLLKTTFVHRLSYREKVRLRASRASPPDCQTRRKAAGRNKEENSRKSVGRVIYLVGVCMITLKNLVGGSGLLSLEIEPISRRNTVGPSQKVRLVPLPLVDRRSLPPPLSINPLPVESLDGKHGDHRQPVRVKR